MAFCEPGDAFLNHLVEHDCVDQYIGLLTDMLELVRGHTTKGIGPQDLRSGETLEEHDQRLFQEIFQQAEAFRLAAGGNSLDIANTVLSTFASVLTERADPAATAPAGADDRIDRLFDDLLDAYRAAIPLRRIQRARHREVQDRHASAAS
jgi:hypothetical protein